MPFIALPSHPSAVGHVANLFRPAHLFLDLRQPKCGSRSNGPRPSGQRTRKRNTESSPQKNLPRLVHERVLNSVLWTPHRPFLTLRSKKIIWGRGSGARVPGISTPWERVGKGGGRDRAKQPRLIRRWINERPHHAARRLDLYILSTSLRARVGGEGAIASGGKSFILRLLDRSIDLEDVLIRSAAEPLPVSNLPPSMLIS